MPNQHRAYTPEETAWLRAHYATASREEVLAAVPGRAWTVIQNQASKLGASGRQQFIPLLPVTVWTPATVAQLLALYPLGGSAAVQQATGLTRVAIRAEASRRQLRYIALNARPKPPKPPKPAKVVAPKRVKVAAPKPAKVVKPPKPTPVLAVKRSAGTPNLNVQKEARRRQELAPQRAAVVTAEQIRALPYNHPGRLAYSLDGVRGWQEWQARS